MKRGLVLIGMLVAMIACDDKGNDVNPAIQAKVDNAKSIANDGLWTITYFFDSDKDETSNFSGVSFDFGSDGALTATKGATVNAGAWSVTGEDDDDDNPDEDLDFNISFSSPADFAELSEDWTIISITASKIELTHVSGGNGGTDFLTFEKN